MKYKNKFLLLYGSGIALITASFFALYINYINWSFIKSTLYESSSPAYYSMYDELHFSYQILNFINGILIFTGLFLVRKSIYKTTISEEI
jgi:hypothetical protein